MRRDIETIGAAAADRRRRRPGQGLARKPQALRRRHSPVRHRRNARSRPGRRSRALRPGRQGGGRPRWSRGCDAIVHLGGVSVERPFEEILEANIKGVFHIYEGARRHGVKRVVFASSNHVIGFHKQDEVLDADCPAPARRLLRLVQGVSAKTCRASTSTATASRPSACASARRFPSPRTAACSSTWLSYRDLDGAGALLPVRSRRWATPSSTACPATATSGGTTARPRTSASMPQDSSEPFRAKVEAQPAAGSARSRRASTRAAPSSSRPVRDALTAMKAELVLDARNAVGESPVWLASEQALYWVDIPARKLYRWQAASGRVDHWTAPEMVGCIAPAPGRRLAVRAWRPACSGMQAGGQWLARRRNSWRRSNTPAPACASTTAAATARGDSAPAPC